MFVNWIQPGFAVLERHIRPCFIPVSWLRLLQVFHRGSCVSLCFLSPEKLWVIQIYSPDIRSPPLQCSVLYRLTIWQMSWGKNRLCAWGRSSSRIFWFTLCLKLQEILLYIWKAFSLLHWLPLPRPQQTLFCKLVMCLWSLKFLSCQNSPTQPIKGLLVSLFPSRVLSLGQAQSSVCSQIW